MADRLSDARSPHRRPRLLPGNLRGSLAVRRASPGCRLETVLARPRHTAGDGPAPPAIPGPPPDCPARRPPRAEEPRLRDRAGERRRTHGPGPGGHGWAAREAGRGVLGELRRGPVAP